MTFFMGSRRKPLELYVNSIDGSDHNDGKDWNHPLATMGCAISRIAQRGKIYVYGKILEDGLYTPQGITDVTIIGAGTNPREGNHRDNGPKSGASDWRYKDSNTNPLITITQQGWRFENMMLRGSGLGGTIHIIRNIQGETEPTGYAGDHASFKDCVFQGPSVFGIKQTGGIINIDIRFCEFRLFNNQDNSAITGFDLSVGHCLFWNIFGNTFIGNWNNINLKLNNSIIIGNIFQRSDILSPNVPIIENIQLYGGLNNTVMGNR